MTSVISGVLNDTDQEFKNRKESNYKKMSSNIAEDDVLVSVIIPVYNVKDYLPTCIESVINQTFTNLDILIIDDGSTDGSERVCDAYAKKDDRIRLWNTENKGLASARNFGLKNCKGSYILFLDSDDWIEEFAIYNMLYCAFQTEADVVVAGICLEYRGQSVPSLKKTQDFKVIRGQAILTAFAHGEIGEMVWNKLYRTGCSANLSFPEGHVYEDVFTSWRIMDELANNDGIVTILSEDMFHYRARKSGISHTKTLNNIVDYWNANCQKIEGLPGYQDILLAGSITAIGHMWVNYYGFSSKEKEMANDVICKMQVFSKKVRRQIMIGKYPLYVKLLSLLPMSNSSVYMQMCFIGWKIINRINSIGNRNYMYD